MRSQKEDGRTIRLLEAFGLEMHAQTASKITNSRPQT